MSVQIHVGFDAAGLAGDAMVSGVGCHVDVGPDIGADVEIGDLGDLSWDSVREGRGGLRVGDGVVAASVVVSVVSVVGVQVEGEEGRWNRVCLTSTCPISI